jgi:tRNA G10  N-methylase Trm11
MSHYLFLLGRTPEMSLAELSGVLQLHAVSAAVETFIVDGTTFGRVELADDTLAQSIFTQLGGSLKVSRQVGEFHDLTPEQLPTYVEAFLAEFPRPTFAIAEFGRGGLPRLELADLKQALKKRKISSRFIEGPRDGLSASVLLHQQVIELTIIVTESATFFAQTLAAQDIDDWTRRDRHKPYSDRKKGMLPPKLARMMVNLARAQWQSTASHTEKPFEPLTYDPFCGSGTILFEVAMVDGNAVGSDLDQKAVMGTQNNIRWFQETYETHSVLSVFAADAATVAPSQLPQPISMIVTEPFLGKQTPNPTQLPNIFKGLEKMYLGVFKQWTKLLANQAVITIVFPKVELLNEKGRPSATFSLENMIDKLEQLGYTSTSQPFLYRRPDATVQRQIWTFQFDRSVAQHRATGK